MSNDEHRWHYDYARLALDTGFNFQTYRSKSLDKIIGHIDVDNIIRERDVGTIEKFISTVVEFSLDNDQTSVLDPTFVKIFRISQLSVQYLLFCKKYLDNSVVIIKQEYQKSVEENKNLKRQIDELHQESSNYKKQIKELRAALNSQTAPNQVTAIFQCKECPKAFSTEEYLLAHIKRRHESLGIVVVPSNSTFQSETDKLQLEIKELKERLNNTEKFVTHNEFMAIKEVTSKPSTEHNHFLTELQEKFEHLKSHVDFELRILQTQKFEKEKYEKWFETFLSNKLNVVNNILPKPVTSTIGTQGEVLTNNCSTQTDLYVLPSENSHVPPQPKLRSSVVKQKQSENQRKIHDTEELQEKLQLEAQNRLEKFEEMLHEKVTGSIEKLQNQMQTFLVKVNELEEQNEKMKMNTSLEKVGEVIKKPAKPKKITSDKRAFSSPTLTMKSTESFNTNKVEKHVPASSSTGSVVIRKYCSSSSESDDETETEESDSGDDNSEIIIHKPAVKISATSTLGRRSLTSLQEVAFTPEVLAQFQKEIEKVMQNRLHEVGVNPKLKRIPARPYQKALGMVTHQASIIQKNIANYMQIRQQILKDVDNQVVERSKTTELSKNSKLKSLLSNFRNRPKNVQESQRIIRKPVTPQVKKVFTENINAVVDLSESGSDRSISKSSGSIANFKSTTAVSIPLDSTDSESRDASSKHAPTPRQLGTLNSVKQIADPINEVESHTKGVLRNFPVAGSLPKKKVIFDLDTAASKENIKPSAQNRIMEGGSTTSIASSVFDGSKSSLTDTEKKKKENSSGSKTSVIGIPSQSDSKKFNLHGSKADLSEKTSQAESMKYISGGSKISLAEIESQSENEKQESFGSNISLIKSESQLEQKKHNFFGSETENEKEASLASRIGLAEITPRSETKRSISGGSKTNVAEISSHSNSLNIDLVERASQEESSKLFDSKIGLGDTTLQTEKEKPVLVSSEISVVETTSHSGKKQESYALEAAAIAENKPSLYDSKLKSSFKTISQSKKKKPELYDSSDWELSDISSN